MDSKNIETLADFTKRIRREKDLSTTDVERASRRGGAKGISNGYISQIENNYIKNVSPEKLKALGRGLGVTEEEIFAVARGSLALPETITNEQLATVSFGYPKMPKQKKEKLDPIIELLEREYQRLLKEDE